MTRCAVKVRYRDKLAAQIALADTSRKSKAAKRDECRFYRCPSCRGWHLTSDPNGAGS